MLVNAEIYFRKAEVDDATTMIGFILAIDLETEGKNLSTEVVSLGVVNVLNSFCKGFMLLLKIPTLHWHSQGPLS